MRSLIIFIFIMAALTINFCAVAAEPKPSALPSGPASSALPGGPAIERSYSAVGLAASVALSQELQPGMPVERAMDEEKEKKSYSSACGAGSSKTWAPALRAHKFGQEQRPIGPLLVFRTKSSSKTTWEFTDKSVDPSGRHCRSGLWHNHSNRAISLKQGGLLKLLRWTDHIPGGIDASTGKLRNAQLGSLLNTELPGYRSSELFCATDADISSFLTYDHTFHSATLYRITKESQVKIYIDRFNNAAHGDRIPLCFRPDGKSFIALELTSARLYDCDPVAVPVVSYGICFSGEQIETVGLECEGFGLKAKITTSLNRVITIGADEAEYVFGPLKE